MHGVQMGSENHSEVKCRICTFGPSYHLGLLYWALGLLLGGEGSSFLPDTCKCCECCLQLSPMPITSAIQRLNGVHLLRGER